MEQLIRKLGLADIVTDEIKGTLLTVSPRQMMVQNDDGVLAVQLTDDTQVRMGAREAGTGDLRPGMTVTVVFVKHFHRRLATTIIVDPPTVVGSR